MEEIDLTELLDYFKSKVIYIILAISIAFCLSCVYISKFRVPVFTSSTTILLNQASDSNAISSSDINLNKSLVTEYGQIIKSKRVLKQVIEKLNLEMEYDELNSMVSVGEVTNTSIIKISVTNKDNILAAEIANMIANVFTEEIVDIYKIENVSVIDKAEISENISSASSIKIITISCLAGIIISIGIIFVIFYFDNTLKKEEEIEKITGLPVIGVVPMNSQRIKKSEHRKYYEKLSKRRKLLKK